MDAAEKVAFSPKVGNDQAVIEQFVAHSHGRCGGTEGRS
jgi:hypothetical protein